MCFGTFRVPSLSLLGYSAKLHFTELSEESVSQILKPNMQFPGSANHFKTDCIVHYYIRVPTRTGKPRKMGRHFPVREKSGKITQNTGKLREFQKKMLFAF